MLLFWNTIDPTLTISEWFNAKFTLTDPQSEWTRRMQRSGSGKKKTRKARLRIIVPLK